MRKTKETEIELYLRVEGKGEAQIRTGIGFFDHMLNSLTRFALFDLTVNVKGDLHVDAHHTIEDTGIVFGQALKNALGDKTGIRRAADCLMPMDEALVQVAVDISNRPFLGWDVPCPDGLIGDFPVEMAEEFMRALAVEAGLTLHVRLLAGKNRHHIIEAVFKGVGKALGEAAFLDPRISGVLSTKGVL